MWDWKGVGLEECKIGNLMVKDLETGKAEAVVTAPTPPPVKDNHEASGKSPDTVPASTSNYSKNFTDTKHQVTHTRSILTFLYHYNYLVNFQNVFLVKL